MSDKQKKPFFAKATEGAKKCQCEIEIGSLKKQIEEYKNKYLRALADYQNFEKRVYEDKEEIRVNANRTLIIKLLSFLDSLDKAELFIKDANLKLVKDNFYKLLHGEGLEEIKVYGKEFDPYQAEVVDLIDGEKANIVVEVLRKGYSLNGKVIRVAQVKVSKKKNSEL
jgi:molecular chaperone GrpE